MTLPFARAAPLAAMLMAGLATAFTVRGATFVPWAIDAGNYVDSARHWAEGRLFHPAPFQLWVGDPSWTEVGLPLGTRPGSIHATDVSRYPPGFPIVLAAGDMLDRDVGVYVVAPLTAGLLVWCTFVLARRIGGPWAGLLAAAMTALSPVALGHAVQAFSDVPAGACFAIGLVMSDRSSTAGAVASGLAIAATVMMRPVMIPLASIPAILIVTAGASHRTGWRQWHWSRLFWFCLVASLGPLIVGGSQYVLYGGFFTPGYPEWRATFDLHGVWTNLAAYPRYIMEFHTPFVFVGIAGALPLARRLASKDVEAARLIAALVAVALLNHAVYLPFVLLETVWLARFVLLAQAALFVLLAAVAVHAAQMAARWHRAAALLCLVPVAFVINEGRKTLPFVFSMHREQANVLMMGRYLREVLPRNAAVFTVTHSAAIRHYTGRQVVRFDAVPPRTLDSALTALLRRGYHPVFVIDQQIDGASFKSRFTGSRYERLDWRPRAVFAAGTAIWYLDFADRDGTRARAPIDVLR